MPLYEYRCESCGARVEVLQRVADAPLATCGECGGRLERMMSAPALRFKGSGWYVTDYGKQRKGGTEGKSEPPAQAETKKDAPAKPAGETKTTPPSSSAKNE